MLQSFKEYIRDNLDEARAQEAAKGGEVNYIVLDLTAVPDLDASALHVFGESHPSAALQLEGAAAGRAATGRQAVGIAGLPARSLRLSPCALSPPHAPAPSDDFTLELKENENATIYLANLNPPVSSAAGLGMLLPAAAACCRPVKRWLTCCCPLLLPAVA